MSLRHPLKLKFCSSLSATNDFSRTYSLLCHHLVKNNNFPTCISFSSFPNLTRRLFHHNFTLNANLVSFLPPVIAHIFPNSHGSLQTFCLVDSHIFNSFSLRRNYHKCIGKCSIVASKSDYISAKLNYPLKTFTRTVTLQSRMMVWITDHDNPKVNNIKFEHSMIECINIQYGNQIVIMTLTVGTFMCG